MDAGFDIARLEHKTAVVRYRMVRLEVQARKIQLAIAFLGFGSAALGVLGALLIVTRVYRRPFAPADCGFGVGFKQTDVVSAGRVSVRLAQSRHSLVESRKRLWPSGAVDLSDQSEVSWVGACLDLLQVGKEISSLVDRVEAGRRQEVAFGGDDLEVALALSVHEEGIDVGGEVGDRGEVEVSAPVWRFGPIGSCL
jgi:hypothetical protein